MILPLEQRQLLSAKATELADSIEAGTYKGPTPTNDRGWRGCAAGVLLAAAGMPVPESESDESVLASDLDDLAWAPGFRSLTGSTTQILRGAPLSTLVEPYRRIASRLLEAP